MILYESNFKQLVQSKYIDKIHIRGFNLDGSHKNRTRVRIYIVETFTTLRTKFHIYTLIHTHTSTGNQIFFWCFHTSRETVTH